MKYNEMRQWRDIAEFLQPRYYKFAELGVTGLQRFSFLEEKSKPYREQLWSSYMLQICQFSPDPYSFYHKVRQRDIEWGWRLLPDWEEKIDFLEQITLFGKNPADVPQPWKARIWEKFLSKMHVVKNETNYIDLNNCPINFDCRSMTGAQDVIFCPNRLQCKNLKRSL